MILDDGSWSNPHLRPWFLVWFLKGIKQKTDCTTWTFPTMEINPCLSNAWVRLGLVGQGISHSIQDSEWCSMELIAMPQEYIIAGVLVVSKKDNCFVLKCTHMYSLMFYDLLILLTVSIPDHPCMVYLPTFTP